jgi:hypothetical protein
MDGEYPICDRRGMDTNKAMCMQRLKEAVFVLVSWANEALSIRFIRAGCNSQQFLTQRCGCGANAWQRHQHRHAARQLLSSTGFKSSGEMLATIYFLVRWNTSCCDAVGGIRGSCTPSDLHNQRITPVIFNTNVRSTSRSDLTDS